MLARIAHELFWLGRYVARADHTARMLDGAFAADLQSRVDDPAAVTLSWDVVLAIMGARVDGANGVATRQEVLDALTLDEHSPSSVVACLQRAREGARTLRDVISAEMWEAVNTTNIELFRGDLERRVRTGPYSVYRYVRERSALFWGLTESTMLRDESHAFLRAGGDLESADMVLRMLRVALAARVTTVDTEDADGHALALLHAAGGLQAFRRAVRGAPMTQPVAHFLLFERSYPDSVAASVRGVREALEAADAQPRTAEPVLRLARLEADLEFRRGAHGEDAVLAPILEHVEAELSRTESDVADRYFAGAAAPAMVTA